MLRNHVDFLFMNWMPHFSTGNQNVVCQLCLILQEIIREAEDNVHFLFMVDVHYEIKRLNFPIFFVYLLSHRNLRPAEAHSKYLRDVKSHYNNFIIGWFISLRRT